MNRQFERPTGCSAVRDPKLPAAVAQVVRSPAQPLDAETRALMETRFNYNFSTVRVHADSNAAESTREVNARAYTVGPDIVFGPGEYHPRAREGQRILAHEIAHVVQQSRGGNAPVPRFDSELEL